MRLLELFAGTGSIGKMFRARGWEVISIDIDATTNQTFVAEILNCDDQMLGGNFDAVWASPPCTQYSIARSNSKTPRDLETSDRLVQRVIDIFDFFNPTCWAFENPQTGLLKSRKVVENIPFVDVEYCMYGARYRKRTRIWTNATGQHWTRLCDHDCEASTGKTHVSWAQKGNENNGYGYTTHAFYAIPPLLCSQVYASAKGVIRLSRAG